MRRKDGSHLVPDKAASGSTWLPVPPLTRPKEPALKPKLTSEMNISEPQRTGHLMDLPWHLALSLVPGSPHLPYIEGGTPTPWSLPIGHKGMVGHGAPTGQELVKNKVRPSSSVSFPPTLPVAFPFSLPYFVFTLTQNGYEKDGYFQVAS